MLTIGFPILASALISSHWGQRSPSDRAHFHPLDVGLVGSQIAQLAIGVLGVLVISGEYSTGMIRASFTAVPKRLPVLWAKALVFAVVTFVLMLPCGADRVLREPVDPLAPPRPGARSRTRASREQ